MSEICCNAAGLGMGACQAKGQSLDSSGGVGVCLELAGAEYCFLQIRSGQLKFLVMMSMMGSRRKVGVGNVEKEVRGVKILCG